MVNFTNSVTLLLTTTSTVFALEVRQDGDDVTCLDDNLQAATFGNVDEAVICTDFLASLGDQDCTADAGGIAFCTQGDTQIFGSTPALPFPETSTARCQDIARSAGRILDKCARLGGTIRGENGVEGNGDISVVISRVIR